MGTVILGIESSCDDTSAAVIRDRELLSNVVASQDVHIQYGGVVPELASRAHQQNIVPVVDRALKLAGVGREQIDAVAFTRGPMKKRLGMAPEGVGVKAQGWNICVADLRATNRCIQITTDGKCNKEPDWVRAK